MKIISYFIIGQLLPLIISRKNLPLILLRRTGKKLSSCSFQKPAKCESDSRTEGSVQTCSLMTVNVLNGYVLLQVRKGDNQSDVDALIHKVIPANKFEKFADTARKHFKNFKRFKVKTQNSDNDLESIVFAIKTDDAKGRNEGNKYGRPRREHINVDSFLSDIKQFVMNFVKPDAARPSFRSNMEKYNLKPVQLGNGDPSMMYEIETTSVLKSLTDALNSPKASRYSDNIAKTAAYVYSMI